MKKIHFGKSIVSDNGPCYIIAEIGHNHQGNLETALKLIQTAAANGANAVKFQKRDNKNLYTKAFYDKSYDNENSYGTTYGEHREFLEFGEKEYHQLKKCAAENNVEFMATAFDFKSADFLKKIGVTSYKIASSDVTNIPLLEYVARFKKPMFVSTGAATMDEIKLAYKTVTRFNKDLCIMHCVAGYPTEYHDLNLNFIEALKKEFPKAIIGYSGHDNGILAAVVAYMLGAAVVEKHFTLNHSWKGTDHKFSLEPEGLRKMVRDLRRIDVSLGNGKKVIHDFEVEAKKKMGKGIYTSRKLKAGALLKASDLCLKTPTNGTPPYMMSKLIGRRLKVDLPEESAVSLSNLK